MTWTLRSSGHHNTSDWVAEEHELLRGFVEAATDDDVTVTSSFEFHGNHVSATSIEDAKEKLEAYDAEKSA